MTGLGFAVPATLTEFGGRRTKQLCDPSTELPWPIAGPLPSIFADTNYCKISNSFNS